MENKPEVIENELKSEQSAPSMSEAVSYSAFPKEFVHEALTQAIPPEYRAKVTIVDIGLMANSDEYIVKFAQKPYQDA
jgi:hypothetical protein